MIAESPVAEAQFVPAGARRSWLPRVAPSLADIFFAAVLIAAFIRPGGFAALLADGDTGWHIRTGELILDTGHIPVADPFSFTRPGAPWFAWEWLSDVVFAVAFRRAGLWAVAALAACALALAATLLFTWLLRRGAGLWIAVAVTLAAVSASSIHFLARPHVFSILFYTAGLWLLSEDRAGRRKWVWIAVPATAVWANLHAGFVAWLATLGLLAAVSFVERKPCSARRYGALASACAFATLANPFGWRLHQHIWLYLRSSWILNHVQEFRSPEIRTEGMLVFALLLLAGAALSYRLLSEARWFEGVLMLGWAFAAMRSARHVPFFAISAAPAIAGACAATWRHAALKAPVRAVHRALWQLGQDLAAPRLTLWLPLFASAALAFGPSDRAASFPASRFPVSAVERNIGLLSASGRRVLTSDQWADYLLFRLYPSQRVFFDGRSDFYGPEMGTDYRALMGAEKNWPALLSRYHFSAALLPYDWPLSTFLDREPGWRRLESDDVAVLFVKEPAP